MERRNCTVMLLLLACAIVQVHSSFESVNIVDIPSGDKEKDDVPSPVTFDEHNHKIIRRTPGAPKNDSERLNALKRAIAQLRPKVSRPEDIAQTHRENLMRQFDGIVENIQRVYRLNREAAIARAMSENRGLVDEIITAHEI